LQKKVQEQLQSGGKMNRDPLEKETMEFDMLQAVPIASIGLCH